ncbi:Nuclease A inhibitor-like protein [Filimonas lacunae]|uniref:Nuclease A inhibitor-like protein n=1 Tax=Filimonas lacunae TaxID=477680 RepID=A0A173MK38_9BACT|nr:nuclease A inhibitor family protein [Filimonas lacunae]BAV07964.1 sugar-non-specific nuclease inhibitor NuiA homolog [Filimonas lacunae]SIT07217.1 Nuclease A inhibitor-like protein [Filimonas lacunae]
MSVQQQLEAASKGLLMMSESDYPFQYVHADATVVTNTLLQQWSGQQADAPVQQVTVEYLFRNMVKAEPGSSREEEAATFRQLITVLKQELQEVTVYRIGQVQVDVFIVGISREGKIEGLQTRLIET